MPVWVIGNGESRRSFQFDTNQEIIGCNAIHRDMVVNHLVCCDRRMVEEAVANPSTENINIYTRPRHYQDFKKIKKHKNVHLLPDLPYAGTTRADEAIHWNSGPFAILLAAKLGYKTINIIGFDLHSTTKKVNNIYKNTANYSSSQSAAVDPGYWIYQIQKIFDCYPDIEFNVFNTKDWQLPQQWIRPNIKLIVI